MRPMYSPARPTITISIPPMMSIRQTMLVQPGSMAAPRTSLRRMVTSANTKPAQANSAPARVASRSGTTEKEVKPFSHRPSSFFSE